jgi:hypothetical protein
MECALKHLCRLTRFTLAVFVEGICRTVVVPSTSSVARPCCRAQRSINFSSMLPSNPAVRSHVQTRLRSAVCPETHWKYNMAEHLRERHPTWEVTMPQHARSELSSVIAISHNEECRLGVPEAAQTAQSAPESQGETTGQKRALDDLTVTPSRTRIVKTARPSRHVAGRCGRQPAARGWVFIGYRCF